MAFVSINSTTLARDLWPDGRGKLTIDNATAQNLPARRILPRDFDTLRAWLCVDPCASERGGPIWFHPDVVGEEERVEIAIRLQGFVDEVSLGMLGNWNGSAIGAPKAVQQLTLTSGGCTDAFSPQVNALEGVRELVLSLLSRSGEHRQIDMHKIVLKRRVFAKVRPHDLDAKTYSVPRAEDPLGRAHKIEHMWAITHRVTGAVQMPDGRVVPQNALVIRRGDFVDVAVSVQVVSYRLSRGRRGLEVQYVPQTVVRLLAADEATV
ncbi:hypothetical protein C8Q79DRAFT_1002822 [Trametes meyenii]|nr:hypothetical protein C8Q79DRAFT_1002822 [Trametes meyenii]